MFLGPLAIVDLRCFPFWPSTILFGWRGYPSGPIAPETSSVYVQRHTFVDENLVYSSEQAGWNEHFFFKR